MCVGLINFEMKKTTYSVFKHKDISLYSQTFYAFTLEKALIAS